MDIVKYMIILHQVRSKFKREFSDMLKFTVGDLQPHAHPQLDR